MKQKERFGIRDTVCCEYSGGCWPVQILELGYNHLCDISARSLMTVVAVTNELHRASIDVIF